MVTITSILSKCNLKHLLGENHTAFKERTMRQFTLFTLLYLAMGVCLTAIALQHPDLTPHLKTILLTAAGLLYLFAGLSTFGFWHQGVLRSQARMGDKPIWQQNFVAIGPWLVIILTVLSIASLLTQGWTTEAIAKASLGLPVILVSAENLFVKSQIRQ
jgi:hypothetical protein